MPHLPRPRTAEHGHERFCPQSDRVHGQRVVQRLQHDDGLLPRAATRRVADSRAVEVSPLAAGRVISVDEDAVRLQHAPLLARDLGSDSIVIALPRICLPELGRSEEATVLHPVERRVSEEVERAGLAEVDAVMLERLAVEIAAVERDRLGAELERQPREPRLEESGALARRGRPARVRSRCDVKDAFSANARQGSKGALEAPDELLQDRFELGLTCRFAHKVVSLIQAREGFSEQSALRTSSCQTCEALEDRVIHYRESMPNSPAKGLSHEDMLRIYEQPKTIAVVGASNSVGKPAHDKPRYLQSQGYRIVPVNPRGGEILGQHAFASLRDVDVPIDVVDVFRPPAEAEAIARDAVAIGAKVVWFQPGTDTDEAAAVATQGGLIVVRRRCMAVTHGLLGLGPGPHPRA